MLLSDMKEMQKAVVSENTISGDFGRRLRDMGFVKGEEVVCIRKAVFSSPILFFVKGNRVALRKKDAEKIEAVI